MHVRKCHHCGAILYTRRGPRTCPKCRRERKRQWMREKREKLREKRLPRFQPQEELVYYQVDVCPDCQGRTILTLESQPYSKIELCCIRCGLVVSEVYIETFESSYPGLGTSEPSTSMKEIKVKNESRIKGAVWLEESIRKIKIT